MKRVLEPPIINFGTINNYYNTAPPDVEAAVVGTVVRPVPAPVSPSLAHAPDPAPVPVSPLLARVPDTAPVPRPVSPSLRCHYKTMPYSKKTRDVLVSYDRRDGTLLGGCFRCTKTFLPMADFAPFESNHNGRKRSEFFSALTDHAAAHAAGDCDAEDEARERVEECRVGSCLPCVEIKRKLSPAAPAPPSPSLAECDRLTIQCIHWRCRGEHKASDLFAPSENRGAKRTRFLKANSTLKEVEADPPSVRDTYAYEAICKTVKDLAAKWCLDCRDYQAKASRKHYAERVEERTNTPVVVVADVQSDDETKRLPWKECPERPVVVLGDRVTTGDNLNDGILQQVRDYRWKKSHSYDDEVGDFALGRENGFNEAFKDVPDVVELHGASNAGDIHESVGRAWRVREGRRLGFEVLDAAGSKRVDGKDNGWNTTEYDWLERPAGAIEGPDDVSVEWKSAGGCYATYDERWIWVYQNVKAKKHKNRYLSIAAPDGIRVFDGLEQSVSSDGVIRWCGPRDVTNARSALEYVLEKHEHLRVVTLRYGDPEYAELLKVRTPAHEAFEGTPLAKMSGCMRGLCVEDIVEHLAKDLFDGQSVERPVDPGVDHKGNPRHASNATTDFVLGGDRLEVKTGTLCWNSSDGHWAVQFEHIKRPLHNLLLFVIHAPDGLHFLLHKGDLLPLYWSESTTPGHGCVAVRAPPGTLKGHAVKDNKSLKYQVAIDAHNKRSLELGTPAVALQCILKKFWLKGACPYLAHVPFPK